MSAEPVRDAAPLRLLSPAHAAPSVPSEVAPLRRVLVHRPGPELGRLSPDNMAELLYDDLPWGERAAAEHDQFCRLLTAGGAEVLRLAELLADVLGDPRVRAEVVAATYELEDVAPSLAAPLRERLDALAPTALAERLIAGVAFDELEAELGSLSARAGGFAGPSGVEGGDVLVVSPESVLVGVGDRTAPAAVERLALRLCAETGVREVLAVEIPHARRTMHLDTLITMVDHDAFVVHPQLEQLVTVHRLTAAGRRLRVEPQPSLRQALARSVAGPCAG